MSSKHLFPTSDSLILNSLLGHSLTNPSLSLIPTHRVLYNSLHSPSNVSIISGGGGGHEPAWGGYVGHNMLAAAVSGDIFASPSARQVESAIRAVPSEIGTILVITNYTGDCLHFGMAAEKANSGGWQKGPVAVVACGDDVSLGSKKGGLVGRRGLPGQVLVLKALSAAAERGDSFNSIMALATSLNANLVSIAATLDHCHVPGRADYPQLSPNVIEIGTGPHNEPGYIKVSPQPSPSDLVGTLLKYLTDETDPARGYLHFGKDDSVTLLTNNFGGMSVLEINALAYEFYTQLPSHVNPIRVYTGFIETSLNAPAFSLSICNLTAAAAAANIPLSDLLSLLDSKTESAWEAFAGAQSGPRRPRDAQLVAARPDETTTFDASKDIHVDSATPDETTTFDASKDIHVDSATLDRSLRRACERVITAEPDLTRWDTIMGDGDCGETFKNGATEILTALDSGLASTGSILKVVLAIANITETKMGGTLGAVLSIFFNALLRGIASTRDLTKAPEMAVRSLEKHTPARVGHRTIMDVLAPAVEGLRREGMESMVEAAKRGAESTRGMGASLGRATYVGGKEEGYSGDVPPDPGAWGAMEAIVGLWEGIEGK